ncbi:MAG: antibiotic biosynthesis monooxygenase [Actinomycetota bacterium]|nr:antibiotic biosynthesis monooxygenase [Actinomycetota bacterium]
MLVVSRFVVPASDGEVLLADARAALVAFAGRPGFRSGRLGRASDDPQAWVLVTEWDGIGAYRRSLSSYDVRVHATPLLARAEPEAGAYEVLLSTDDAGPPAVLRSGRAADAGAVRVGEAAAPAVPVEGEPPEPVSQ